MKKIVAAALCAGLTMGTIAVHALNPDTDESVSSDKLLPLHRSVQMAKEQSCAPRAKEQKECLLLEQKFVNLIGNELISISTISDREAVSYTEINDCILDCFTLIIKVLNEEGISKKARVALFGLVEESIQLLAKKKDELKVSQQTRLLTGQNRCTSPGNSASQADLELNANMSATPDELHDLLAGLSLLKENVKKVENVRTALSWGYVVGVPLAISVAAALGLWLAHDKLCSRNENTGQAVGPRDIVIAPSDPRFDVVAAKLELIDKRGFQGDSKRSLSRPGTPGFPRLNQYNTGSPRRSQCRSQLSRGRRSRLGNRRGRLQE